MVDSKGLYVALENNTNNIGFSISAAFHQKKKDFQISILFLDFALAIGWLF